MQEIADGHTRAKAQPPQAKLLNRKLGKRCRKPIRINMCTIDKYIHQLFRFESPIDHPHFFLTWS